MTYAVFDRTLSNIAFNFNVGIGTTVALTPLHVQGNQYISGNLGIGTTTPTAPFHLASRGFVTGSIGFGTTQPLAPLDVNVSSTSNAVAITQRGLGSALNVSTLATADALVVNNSGYVGIGTSGPVVGLHVEGNSYVNGNIGIGTTNPQKGVGIFQSSAEAGARIQSGVGGNRAELYLATKDADKNAIGYYNQPLYIGRATNATNATGTVQPTMVLSTTDNVGIGTTIPQQKLHVVGNILATGTVTASNMNIIGDFVTLNTVTSNTEQMVVNNAGTGPALKVIQSGANVIAEFEDAESGSAMFIANGGNVGIGTATPLAKTHIYHAGTGDILRVDDSTAPDTTPFMINQDGNVGIGTSTPYEKLHVMTAAVIQANSSNTGNMRFVSEGGANYIQSGLLSTAGSSAPLIFGTLFAGSEWGRFDANGNIGIGTATPLFRSHVHALQYANSLAVCTFTSNAATRPAVGTSVINGEIHAFGCGGGTSLNTGADDGFMRISAGGGTNATAKTYIDLSGYSLCNEMTDNIVFGTKGTEKVRINPNGNIGIGVTNPSTKLQVAGAIRHASLSYVSQATYTIPPSTAQTTYLLATSTLRSTFRLMISQETTGIHNDVILTINNLYSVAQKSTVSLQTGNWGSGNMVSFIHATNDSGTNQYECRYYLKTSNSIAGNASLVVTLLECTGEGTVTLSSSLTSQTPPAGYSLYEYPISNTTYSIGTNGPMMTLNMGGNMGIGTTNPSTKLQVEGTVTATAFSGSGASLTGLTASQIPNIDTSKISSGVFSIYRIPSTIPCGDDRQVSPSEATTGTVSFHFGSWNNNNAGPFADIIHFNSYHDSSGGRVNMIAFRKNIIGMRIYQGDILSTTNYSSYNDVVLADASGNVGVAGTLNVASTLTTSGNVGIGTATPLSPFHTHGAIRYTNRPTAGTVTTIGVDANNIITTSSSSIRYKENVQPYTKSLADVQRLNPVTYNYKGENIINAGLIAETLHDDGFEEFVIKNAEGEPESIPYGNMVTILINAVKELHSSNQQLFEKLAALESKINT